VCEPDPPLLVSLVVAGTLLLVHSSSALVSPQLATRLTEDSLSMLGGIGPAIAQAIQYSAAFVAGIVVGFVSSWQLTLLVFACVPVMVVIMGFLKRFTTTFASRVAAAYAKAGDCASETVANIRTVLAYGGGNVELARYDSHLLVAMRVSRFIFRSHVG
jgi:ATP-binding cassette, subfamily B (MDR/TAP), member 1